MPNGGMLPCCFVCDHGKSDLEDASVECAVHNFVVHHGMHTFCKKLSLHGASQKADYSEFLDEMVYAWVQVVYKTKENPTLPQYHHQIEPLALITGYKNWTAADHAEASQALYAKVKRGFIDRSDTD